MVLYWCPKTFPIDTSLSLGFMEKFLKYFDFRDSSCLTILFICIFHTNILPFVRVITCSVTLEMIISYWNLLKKINDPIRNPSHMFNAVIFLLLNWVQWNEYFSKSFNMNIQNNIMWNNEDTDSVGIHIITNTINWYVINQPFNHFTISPFYYFWSISQQLNFY